MKLLTLLILADDLGVQMYPLDGVIVCIGKYPGGGLGRKFNRAVRQNKPALLRMLRKPVQDGVDLISLYLDSLCEGK